MLPKCMRRAFFRKLSSKFLRVRGIPTGIEEQHTGIDLLAVSLDAILLYSIFSNLARCHFRISTVIELVTGGKIEHIGGAVTGNISDAALALAGPGFCVIHTREVFSRVFRDLVRGTYGQHGHHEEHAAECSKPWAI